MLVYAVSASGIRPRSTAGQTAASVNSGTMTGGAKSVVGLECPPPDIVNRTGIYQHIDVALSMGTLSHLVKRSTLSCLGMTVRAGQTLYGPRIPLGTECRIQGTLDNIGVVRGGRGVRRMTERAFGLGDNVRRCT